jgi:uncharacterized protein
MKWSPVGESQRIDSLDILRGIAIFGILLVNMKSFSGPDDSIRSLSYEYFTGAYNMWTNVLLDFFVQGNFITMFSFLFGFGMILMAQRAEENERRFVPVFIRRQLALLLFGILHVVFFWYGDILITYSFIGLIMLLFYKLPPKILLNTGIVLLIIYSVLMTSLTYLYWKSGAALSEQSVLDTHNLADIQKSIHIYSEGTFIEVAKERIREWTELNSYLPIFIFGLLPSFLFGAYAAKRRKFSNEHLWKLWVITLVLGAGSKALPIIWFGYKGEDWHFDTAMSWGYEFGGPVMSIFYICSIVLLYRYGKFKQLFNFFRATGRMAFTNYLIQSIVATFIFYSYGLGLYGKYGPLTGICIAIIIYSLQIVFSKWWLKHYYLGPFEWVWRSMTYGKIQRLRREQAQSN